MIIPERSLYNSILQAKQAKTKLLAILLDPDKIDLQRLDLLLEKINQSPATHIFVGGSHVMSAILEELISQTKTHCRLPLLLFPGHPSQISGQADGILFLNLISGRNPDFLIEHQVNAVPILKKTNLEVISTGYILVKSGKQTAVERVSKTQPLDPNNPKYILQTAQAGELMGNKLIYLEAGSGADSSVPAALVKLVSKGTSVPLLVGGGIRSFSEIEKMHQAGADLVVIGTAFENNVDFFTKKQTP